jgi:hypothetical protein
MAEMRVEVKGLTQKPAKVVPWRQSAPDFSRNLHACFTCQWSVLRQACEKSLFRWFVVFVTKKR